MEFMLQDKLVCLKGNDTIDLLDTVQTILKRWLLGLGKHFNSQ